MKNLIKYNSGVKEVIDKSDSFMKRVLIKFNNGEDLSVIRGEYSYGGKEGLFEIMPSDTSVFDEDDRGDEVLGYLTIERVNYYVAKMAKMKMLGAK